MFLTISTFHSTALRYSRRQLWPALWLGSQSSVVIVNHPIRALSQETIQNFPKEDHKENRGSSTHNEETYEENIKKEILSNAMQFVSRDGWSIEAISAGAEAMGYPGVTHGLFPNGGGDLVHFFSLQCNEKLVAQMKEWPKTVPEGMKIPAKFIENAIINRILMIEPYKKSWPKAMALKALPSNVPNSLAALLSLVDDICYHSGDRSVDINWYIRRVGLAGIYKAAELFYLTDNSQDNNATKQFVASRIRDAQLIQSTLNMGSVTTAAPHALTAAFVTAKNILGLNSISFKTVK